MVLVMCCTVSPKFLCGRPNPQPLWLGPCLEMGLLQMQCITMRPHWSRVGPQTGDRHPDKRETQRPTCTQGEGPVKAEAEIGVTLLQPRNPKDGQQTSSQ